MFNLMYEHQFEIATGTDETSEESIFSPVAKGINNVEPANNEELDQTVYLDSEGMAETDVISAQLTLAFTGHRFYGDEAQDFIFGKLTKKGQKRRTEFRWTQPNGEVLEGSCTITNIAPGAGDAGAKAECSFEIHFNGSVERTEATA